MLAFEKLRPDTAALCVMAALMLGGVVDPGEAVQGFANKATLTVGAMFVLSAGLLKSGALNFVADSLGHVFDRNFWAGLIAMMFLIGAVSGFINNTAAVAIFLPLILRAARRAEVSASKVLMPLSFASMFGGVCTLIGTSTNILVSSIAAERGLEPFGMFEFAPLGVLIFAAGLPYMLFAAARLIPEREAGRENLTGDFQMANYLTDVRVLQDAGWAGKAMRESPFCDGTDDDIEILAVYREDEVLKNLSGDTILKVGDVLRIRSDVERIRDLQRSRGVLVLASGGFQDKDLNTDEAVLLEAVIAPNSPISGKTLKKTRLLKNYGASILAIGRRGRILHERLDEVELGPGNTLLLQIPPEQREDLTNDPAFVMASEVPEPEERPAKIWPSVLIVASVVTLAAAGVFSILTASIAGAVLMILTGCLRAEEAYEAIDWQVIFLLAGVLSLGVALETTGGAELLADGIAKYLGPLGPAFIVSAIFLVTFLLTNVISNNASAALFAPVAITLAESLNVDPRPLLMAVTFAASLSFMTPIGYQTNTFIYGPGRYKFGDFFRVGTPLNFILWVIASVMIPVIWPF